MKTSTERVRQLCDGEELVVCDGQSGALAGEESLVDFSRARTALVEGRNRLAERRPDRTRWASRPGAPAARRLDRSQ